MQILKNCVHFAHLILFHFQTHLDAIIRYFFYLWLGVNNYRKVIKKRIKFEKCLTVVVNRYISNNLLIYILNSNCTEKFINFQSTLSLNVIISNKLVKISMKCLVTFAIFQVTFVYFFMFSKFILVISFCVWIFF